MTHTTTSSCVADTHRFPGPALLRTVPVVMRKYVSIERQKALVNSCYDATSTADWCVFVPKRQFILPY